MEDFVESLGRALFAHRLRRLSESLVEGCREWMPEVGVTAPPKAGSTLLLLSTVGPLTVTEIASRLKLSHPLLIQLTRELEALGLVRVRQDPKDGRRRVISLSAAGRSQAERFADVNAALDTVYKKIFKEAGVDGFSAVEKIEHALTVRGFADRLRNETRSRPRPPRGPAN